jgi:septal ring factor EnvC (AmiA/AmiB activator)
VAKRSENNPLQRVEELKAQRTRELQAIVDRLTREVAALEARLAATDDQSERIMLKAEIAHFNAALDRLQGGAYGAKRRKPPESDHPVPAVPPRGPVPKQGGAAAPLDSDS